METVRVLVMNTQDPTLGPQALPDMAKILRERLATKAIDVSVEALKSGLVQTVSKLLPIMDELPETDTHEVTSIDLILSIDAEGQVALVGTASIGLQVGSGITVTITKKQKSST
jgi:hypothetical protein